MAASETAATPDTFGNRSVLLLTFANLAKAGSLERPLSSRLETRDFAKSQNEPAPEHATNGFCAEKPGSEAWHAARIAASMAQRRVHPAAIAAASDGSVLMNVAELLPAALQERLAAELGPSLFVGVALSERDAGSVVARLDGAAAEASAHLLARRPQKRANSAKSPAKRRR